MVKLKMSNELFIPELMSGSGTLKYYDYFVNGIKVRSKGDVYRAIKNKTKNICQKDKIDGKITKFNHLTLSFE